MADGVLRLGADAKVPNPGYLKLLVEFGYPHDLACTALVAVHNESLETAIDWLDKNRDALDAVQTETERRPVLAGPPAPATVPAAVAAAEPLLNSDIRPDGLSRSKLEAERKAHADYKRQKQMQEERELLKKKEADAKEVRERYAREKAAKAAQKNAAAAVAPVAAAPAAASAPKPGNANAEVVIQVRIPNRPPVTIKGLTGGSSLAELYARVDAECGRSDFVLTQPFPPPVTHFQRGGGQTLAELGLCPRAALTVTDTASLGKVSQGVGAPPAVPAPGFPGLPMGPPVLPPVPAPAPAAVAHKYRGPPQTCLVCQDQLVAEQEARTLGCGHVFHDECLQEWLGENPNTCPGCNQQE
jgi:hypothetical protein